MQTIFKLCSCKEKSAKKARKAKRQQLEYVKRDISYVENYLSQGRELGMKLLALFLVIKMVYDQHKEVYDKKKYQIKDRIVSIFQPHVQPIVRGKAKAKVEFGAKFEISVVDGYVRMEKLSWDAFNKADGLIESVERFKERTGVYPVAVQADKLYRNKVQILSALHTAFNISKLKIAYHHWKATYVCHSVCAYWHK